MPVREGQPPRREEVGEAARSAVREDKTAMQFEMPAAPAGEGRRSGSCVVKLRLPLMQPHLLSGLARVEQIRKRQALRSGLFPSASLIC